MGLGRWVADRRRDVTEEATPTTTRSTFPADPGDAADPSTREIKLIHVLGELISALIFELNLYPKGCRATAKLW